MFLGWRTNSKKNQNAKIATPRCVNCWKCPLSLDEGFRCDRPVIKDNLSVCMIILILKTCFQMLNILLRIHFKIAAFLGHVMQISNKIWAEILHFVKFCKCAYCSHDIVPLMFFFYSNNQADRQHSCSALQVRLAKNKTLKKFENKINCDIKFFGCSEYNTFDFLLCFSLKKMCIAY